MNNTIKSDIKPFKMYGNLYFVGSSRVSVHVIKTEVGLLMIDTGWPDMYEQIVDSMEEVGLNPKDICAIFHSHGHIDHFGCTQRFKEISGAKTYISRIDNDIVNGKLDLSWANEAGLPKLPFFNCDVLIEDGDSFTFGNTTIRARLTPGHTDGVMSYFVNVEENGKSIIAGMHGGIGRNTLRSDFIKRYNLSYDCRKKFRESIELLKNEHVDLVMGNHAGHNDTVGKLEKVLSGKDSVVDTEEWGRLLNFVEESLAELILNDPEK